MDKQAQLQLLAKADGQGLRLVHGGAETRFCVKGASHFGMETDICVPHGLWGGDQSTTLRAIAALLRTHDFNLVRLPLAVDAVLENRVLANKYVLVNEKALLDAFEGRDLRYLDVLDYVINEYGKHGLLVLLDMHVLQAGGAITPLWYSGEHADTLSLPICKAWELLAHRYASTWNVIGADVKNEPHDEATWGSNDVRTDWRLAATAMGNKILSICSRWLIFVEGTQHSREDDPKAPCFWGENLVDAHAHPIQLAVADRLVLSPHTYGPDVSDQPYFHAQAFPANMPSIWDAHFGSLRHCATLVVGEWGGKYHEDRDRAWQQAFAAYLQATQTGCIYWCVNPNSGDTEGLLAEDWLSPRQDKLAMLAQLKGTLVPMAKQ